MKSTFLSRVVCVVGLMAVTAGASCSHDDPEGFCQSWVESTCQALSGCCHTGTTFDPNECQIEQSRSCQASTDADAVEAGEVKFDSGAASTCLGTVTSCSEAETPAPETYAHQQACANMVTGYVPVGAACSGANQCEQAGDFTVCYNGTGSISAGVCAQVVLDTTTCSFSFSNFELHVCPDGMFCDSAPSIPTSGEPTSQQAFEFSASCKPDVSAGGDCFGAAGQPLPCAAGLSCQVTGPATATCTASPAAGQACGPTVECGGDLECVPGPTGMWTCQAPDASYCFLSESSCEHCAEALMGGIGSPGDSLCDGSSESAYTVLVACACGGSPCDIVCSDSLCDHLGASDDCNACIAANCPSEQAACAED